MSDRVIVPAVTEHDVDILARTLYGEARGEGIRGMEAVADCIRNRVTTDLHHDFRPDWWGEGYAGVCLAPWQFSCWNQNDPNRAKLIELTEDDPVLHTCVQVALRCVKGHFGAIVNGGDHYLTRAAYRASGEGHWSRKTAPVAEVGAHLFFRLGG